MKSISTRVRCVALAALFGLTGVATVWADTDKTMTEGVVRKIDPDNRKVTIKHGEIKNLDMPGMTMVFRLESALDVQSLKPGDKVLFHAEKIDGAFVITDLQNTP